MQTLEFRAWPKFILGYSGEQLARHLHTDKTKISKWERGEDPIGQSSDRLMRLLVSTLDVDLVSDAPSVAAHLPAISNQPGKEFELHLDVDCLTASFVRVKLAQTA